MANHKITAYEGTENYIFISYAHKDAGKVFPIMEQLHRRGYRIWYDDGIAPGSEWPEDIARHLNNSAMVIAFVTPNSMASVNCRREINFALSKEKPFLSVVLEPTEMPLGMELQLSAQQSVIRYNYREEETFLEKICACPGLARCKGEPKLRETPAPVSEAVTQTSAAPEARESKAVKNNFTGEEAARDKTDLVRKSGRMLAFWVGGAALVLLAAIVVFVIFGLQKPDAPDSPAVPTAPVDSGAPLAPSDMATQPEEETFLVHAKVPKLWTRVDLWAWSAPDGRKAFDAQPGASMEPDEEGWYTVKVPVWVNRVQVNGNFGVMDTPTISVESKEVWIVINEDLSYQLSYEGPFEGTVTIYAQVPEDWDEAYCWAWTPEQDAFDAWPGGKMEKKGDWYVVEVPNWINGININMDTFQSEDIIVESGWSVWIVERNGWWIGFYKNPTEAEIQKAFAGLS